MKGTEREVGAFARMDTAKDQYVIDDLDRDVRALESSDELPARTTPRPTF